MEGAYYSAAQKIGTFILIENYSNWNKAGVEEILLNRNMSPIFIQHSVFSWIQTNAVWAQHKENLLGNCTA